MHTLHTTYVDLSPSWTLVISAFVLKTRKVSFCHVHYLICHSLLETGTNQCAENNGGCSHLCLAYPGGHTCRCTQGYIAVDDTQCVSGLQCPAGSKPCRDRYKCLSITRFCDQVSDCQDGSDEEGCPAKQNDVLVRTMGHQSCNSEFCNGQGSCIMQKGKPVCECVQGHSGQFCQDEASSSVPVVLSVLFIIGLVIAAAAVLKWRYVLSLQAYW